MKILIVDDEMIFRKALIQTMNWSKIGIDKCLEANNGLEALNIVVAQKPEIIMVDINMPKMNGLSFIDNVNNLGLLVKIVIVSGYDNFEYAKSAIKLKIVEYVLKPIDEEEFTKLLSRLVKEIKFERLTKQLKNNMMIKQNRTNKIAKEYYLERLLTPGIQVNRDDLHNKLMEFNCNLLTKKDFVIVLVKINNNKNLELATFIICNVLEEQLFDSMKCEKCITKDYKVAIILSNMDQNKIGKVIKIIKESQTFFTEFFNIITIIGVGNIKCNFDRIYKSYEEANFAITNTIFEGKNEVTVFKEFNKKK